jgi:plastocyanin
MTRLAIPLAASFLLIALAGCNAPTEDGSTPSPTTSPAATTLAVALTQAPTSAAANSTITVKWSVAPSPSASLQIPHTAIHWGTQSVADPKSPADYGTTQGAREPATVPANFETAFQVPGSGSIYLRAHALVGGKHYWSAEATITITASSTPQPTTHTVLIGQNVKGPSADYSPTPLTIKVNDKVKWENKDAMSHTASKSGSGAFDTGTISSGGTSSAITFTQAGTFDYVCNIHPSTMSGRIVVQN